MANYHQLLSSLWQQHASRFENMARKQPRCATGPPCGRQVPGRTIAFAQGHKYVTHLATSMPPLVVHPTNMHMPLYRPPPVPSPGSVEQPVSKILCDRDQLLLLYKTISSGATRPICSSISLFLPFATTCSQASWQRLRGHRLLRRAAATSAEWLAHCKHTECVTGPVVS